jgi:hypothetical protein
MRNNNLPLKGPFTGLLENQAKSHARTVICGINKFTGEELF